MKLDYKILWLDDKMDIIIEGEYDQEIRDYLASHGFEPIVETVKNEKDFFEKLDDSYDLILTDYHLNESKGAVRDGDTIIREIRDKSIFTEIMFYSAQGEVVDTIKLDRITFVDTRRSTIRNHNEAIVDRIKQLISLTIKKFQHIVVMRGMIMNETSDLDVQMLEVIKGALKDRRIDFNTLASVVYGELEELFTKKAIFVTTCKQKGNFRELTNDTFAFSAKYKIMTLGQILDSLSLENFSEEYDKQINSLRNKFAHSVLLKDPSTGRQYFKYGDEGITFDDDFCRIMRENIRKHKINLESLLKKIQTE